MPRGGGGGGRSGGGGGGTVQVSGYTRSNGTYVSGYTRSAPSSSSGGGCSGGGSVEVSGYTRSNGTCVSGYTRSAPSSTPSPKPRSSEGNGRVQVSGYTRSDGTEVSGYTRTAPRTEYRNLQLQKERGDTYSGKYKTQASHVVSVDEREEFDLPPESETLRNLRNQNEYTNLSVHKRIDNGLLRMWRKGEFCMDEINRGRSGDSSYISPQEVHDRIVQKIEVAKAQGDLQDPSFKEYLYKAADMADVDLRIFNGPQTGRVSGGSAAAEAGNTMDFVGGWSQPLAHGPSRSDSINRFIDSVSHAGVPQRQEQHQQQEQQRGGKEYSVDRSELTKRGQMRAQYQRIIETVLADREWVNEDAPLLAQAMQNKIYGAAKQSIGDGYKIVVLAEVVAPGSGQATSLIDVTSSDDYVVEAVGKNPRGMMGRALVTGFKYI